MRVIKPFAVGLLSRNIEHKRRLALCITASVYFPFAPRGQGTAWSEMSMWNFLGQEMPEGALIDEGVVKTRAEFLVHGAAYASAGKLRQCLVRARVGQREKLLQIYGPRVHLNGQTSEPQPFDRVPLDWAHAYGGPDFAANPLGMGRAFSEAGGARMRVMPQIEDPNAPITRLDAAIAPASMDRIDIAWPQRRRFQGSYGARWLEDQSPGFADDVDWRFFNLASEDQWFDTMLVGDESFSFDHMHASKPNVRGELPGLRARCFVADAATVQSPLREVALQLSTVWFFPHAERGVMLFQGLTHCVEDDASDIGLLTLALERLGQEKPAAHYASAVANRLDPRRGALHALRESDLLPQGLQGSDPDFDAMQADYRPEGLMGQAQRRGAALMVDIARDDLRAKGMDPDKLGVRMPEPLKLPTLEELPEVVDKAQTEALNAQVTALLDAAEQTQQAQAKAVQAGIDPASLQHRGPPLFRAAAQLQTMLAQLPPGVVKPDGQPLLDAAKLAPQLKQLEVMERAAYLAGAHQQAAAPAMAAQHAQQVRESVLQAHAEKRSFMGADLTGADLSGLDLRGADFTAAWLESANLRGALLAGCSFAGAVLAHADLSAADASDADFSAANLGRAKLDAVRLLRANLSGAILSDTALANTDMRQARLDGATLLGASFGRADWRGVKASGLIFLKANLQDMVWHQAHLVQPQFVECDLSGADFSAATLDRASFVQCRGSKLRCAKAMLPGAVFVQGCVFDDADFSGAQMKGSNLRGASLLRARFVDAVLDECDLSDAVLSGADLQGASLRGSLLLKTVLRGAVLAQANLMDAIVQRADLRSCDLRGAHLFGADLSRVRSDTITDWGQAIFERTRVHPRREVEPASAPASAP